MTYKIHMPQEGTFFYPPVLVVESLCDLSLFALCSFHGIHSGPFTKVRTSANEDHKQDMCYWLADTQIKAGEYCFQVKKVLMLKFQ